jgi:hypothetical protein
VRRLLCGLPILWLAGCGHGIQNSDAVRKGVVEYVAKIGVNMDAMDVKIDSVQYNGDKATAQVSYYLKGNSTPAMNAAYRLEQKEDKWVVVGREGSSGHGAAQAPPAENPHGGGGAMPHPDDLPPAGKKK